MHPAVGGCYFKPVAEAFEPAKAGAFTGALLEMVDFSRHRLNLLLESQIFPLDVARIASILDRLSREPAANGVGNFISRAGNGNQNRLQRCAVQISRPPRKRERAEKAQHHQAEKNLLEFHKGYSQREPRSRLIHIRLHRFLPQFQILQINARASRHAGKRILSQTDLKPGRVRQNRCQTAQKR